jgi:hypothetical protein
MPGVSMSKRFCLLGAPKKLVRIHSTSVVSDIIALEVLNIISPHKEFANEDFPYPVTPMRHAILNSLDIVVNSEHFFLNWSAK